MTREVLSNLDRLPVPLSEEVGLKLRSAVEQLKNSENVDEQAMSLMLVTLLAQDNRPLTVRELANTVTVKSGLADSSLRRLGQDIWLRGVLPLRIKLNQWLKDNQIPVQLSSAIPHKPVVNKGYPQERLYVLKEQPEGQGAAQEEDIEEAA